ncbi:MAG: O-antigen ligase family protein [Anaerolineae bacterium]|nr:O-antigen ligase family protein [Anaerolineae bacterium]
MLADATRLHPRHAMIAWAGLALGVGLCVALLPLPLVVIGLGAAGLSLILLAEPALGLVVMLSVAPLKTLIATEAPVALPVDVGQLAFALTVGAWLVQRISTQRDAPLPRSQVLLSLVAIPAAFSVSLIHAVSATAWLSEMMKWVEIIILVFVVRDLGVLRWRWIAFGVVLAGVLQALIGLYEYQGGSGAAHLWIGGFQHFRAFGTFGQPNPFSAFMGLTLPVSLGLTWGYTLEIRRAWRHNEGWQGAALAVLFYALASVILLAGLIASWGRGAWLGFGAAGVVMVCFAPPRWWQAFGVAGAAGVLLIVLWIVGLIPASMEARITSGLTEFTGFRDVRGVHLTDENYAIVERLAHWQAALNMARAHPLTGVGLGHYEVVYAEYNVPSWPDALGHAHNDYLNLLAETGMVGLGVYLAGWAMIVLWTIRARLQHSLVLHGLALGLLGAWTHLAVHSMVDKLYVNNLFLHLGVLLGLLAVADHHHRSSIEHGLT